MPTWPATLPQYPLREGFQAAAPDRLIATEMDAGPPKVRQRFTASHTVTQCQWKMSYAQLDDFRTWLRVDLAGGSLSFTWPSPLAPGNTVIARFAPKNLPRYASAGVRWLVSAEVWILI